MKRVKKSKSKQISECDVTDMSPNGMPVRSVDYSPNMMPVYSQRYGRSMVPCW